MTADPQGALARAPELSQERILARAAGENFPVAPRLLPRRWREPLLALYGFARLVDEIGDAAPGDRLALLDALELELERAFRGRARHPLLVRLSAAIASHELPREPFLRLIEANRWDQELRQLASWQELLSYCSLAANPVGELVLHVFGVATPDRLTLSDAVCSALQVIEHCQDVREDHARGRVYLPAEDLLDAGCEDCDLGDPGSPALRRVLSVQIARARELLTAGAPLVARLSGFARLAVAGYVGGGLAACDALERASFDASRPAARPAQVGTLRHAARLAFSGAPR
jgi:squalene synthase HpnC